MLNQFSRRVLLSFVVVLLLAVCYALLSHVDGRVATSGVPSAPHSSSSPSSVGQMLQAPFAGVASAAPSSDVMTSLQELAGISAHYHITTGIDLDLAYSLFQTVSNFDTYQEDGYIMGMIDSNAYDEWAEPRIFISREGWIVAYQPKDRTHLMLDLYTCNILIKPVVQQIGTALGATATTNLYHFDHPDSTNVLILREYGSGHMSVKMPEDSTLYHGFIYTEGGFSIDLDGSRVIGTAGGFYDLDETNFAVGEPAHTISNGISNRQDTCVALFYSR